MKGKTAAQFYKKIEVLKDIPATEIHPAMEYITLALGVGCRIATRSESSTLRIRGRSTSLGA